MIMKQCYFKDLPAMIDGKTIAKILFGEPKESYVQRIRRLSAKGKFPKPIIPSNNGGGRAMWSTLKVERWYTNISKEDNYE